MKTNLLTGRLWSGCLAGLLIGCGIPAGAPGNAASGGANDTADGAFTFEGDADPTLASLPFIETELLVQPYPGADAHTLTDLYTEAGAVIVDQLDEVQLTVLKVPEDQLVTIATELSSSGLIEGIQKNYIYDVQRTPNDPMFLRQRYLTRIGATEAWDVTVGSEDIIVAIVDTGVDLDHPDLAGKILDGWNVHDNDAAFGDVDGHGTQAAGVAAAASNNGMGVTGVTWECPILAVRATNGAGRATSRHIAAGILWAVGRGARVINVSFAPLWSNAVVRSAAEYAYSRGSLVVISAGNGAGMTTSPGYDEALFIGAVNGSDEIASFSDRGPFVDLVAPGTGIRTIAPGSGYQLVNGTSFAAPIVAGVAALAWSVNPDLRPVSIVEALVDSAIDLGARGPDSTFGHGAVDAAGAVTLASEASFVSDATPPTLSITRPSDGAVVSGRYTVSVTAADRWGVADIVMFVDEVPFATDTRVPYRFVIDAAAFTPGRHELTFVATDRAGHASDPRTVTVTFADISGGGSDGPGEVIFHSPSPGAQVSGNVTISATISAEPALATVEWLADGEPVFVTAVSGRSSRVSYVWRTAGVPVGRHTITLIVTDAKGRQTIGHLELTIV